MAVTTTTLAALAGDPLADRVAAGAAERATNGCLQLSGVTVDLGPWPAVPHAVTGTLRHASASIAAATVGSLTIRDVQARLGLVEFTPLGALHGKPRVRKVEGSATVRITQTDLDRYLARRGLPGDITIHHQEPQLQFQVAGLDLPLTLSTQAGALVISPPLPSLSRLGLRVSIEGIAVTAIRPEDAQLLITAHFAGQPGALACAARSAVE
ncbi:MAG TPA: LmeA family phospholipid-binding protein [Acidimicrobiales bacterium]|nr:LmeA family phospholipid-binding protein [Acidimicrobiales bacterium]